MLLAMSPAPATKVTIAATDAWRATHLAIDESGMTKMSAGRRRSPWSPRSPGMKTVQV